MALTPIEKAKRAAKSTAAQQENAANAARRVEAKEKKDREALAKERLDEDYPKWMAKVQRAAARNADDCSCHPFQDYDKDYTKIVAHHGDLWEAWGKIRGSQFSELQYAYLHALGDRLREDGFTVRYLSEYENVVDYGVVEECALYVSGWKEKEPSRGSNW